MEKRIDAASSQTMTMQEKIDAGSSQRLKITRKIIAGSSQMMNMEKKLEEKLNVMEGKIENIEASRNRFPYGWKYLGRGVPEEFDQLLRKWNVTLTECTRFCEKKRSKIKDDVSWNGLFYYAYTEHCTCVKGDSGHMTVNTAHTDTDYTDAVHFRWELE